MSGSSAARARPCRWGSRTTGRTCAASSQEVWHCGHDRMHAPAGPSKEGTTPWNARRGEAAASVGSLAETACTPVVRCHRWKAHRRASGRGQAPHARAARATRSSLQRKGRKLGQVLIDLGMVNETQLTQTLGQPAQRAVGVALPHRFLAPAPEPGPARDRRALLPRAHLRAARAKAGRDSLRRDGRPDERGRARGRAGLVGCPCGR
jgi:hypothetical protein